MSSLWHDEFLIQYESGIKSFIYFCIKKNQEKEIPKYVVNITGEIGKPEDCIGCSA